ncbi:MAG TPA: hypothetical protein VFN10_09355 [Thermoanaerobaculia bacterium]|nr:hypothetical protein [Thermoanaerobaculia bacterium]
MAILLSYGISNPEIRVLQEFRRLKSDTLGIAALKAIKHPSGGGEAPAASLVEKGWLDADEARENFTLTQRAKDFLAIDAKPEGEAAGEAEEVIVE